MFGNISQLLKSKTALVRIFNGHLQSVDLAIEVKLLRNFLNIGGGCKNECREEEERKNLIFRTKLPPKLWKHNFVHNRNFQEIFFLVGYVWLSKTFMNRAKG